MVAPCPYPFLTLPNDTIPCTTSIATAGGSAFLQYQIAWLAISVSCFLISLIQNIRLWRIKGLHPRLFLTNLQHQIYGVTLPTTLFIMIRGFDPNGWSGRYFQADQHLVDWATIGDYTLFTLGACSWLKIITGISGGQVIYVEYFQRGCIALLTCFVSTVSLLKCYAHPSWFYYTMNLVFVSSLNVTLVIIAWIYGYRIHHQLSHSLTLTSYNKSDPTSQTTSPASSPRQSYNRRKEGVPPQRQTVSTIFKLLVAITICTGIAVTFQVMSILNALETRFDYRDRPMDLPQFTFLALFQQSILTLAQEAVVLITLYYFRRLPSKTTTTQQGNTINGMNGTVELFTLDQKVTPRGSHKSPPPLPPDTPYHLSRMNITATSLTPTLPTAQLETYIDIPMEGR